jgi:hypothetical protein
MSLISRVVTVAIVGLALMLLLGGSEQQPATPEGVRQVYASYKQAVLSSDGSTAAALITRETVEWYERSKQLALHGSKADIDPLPPMLKFQVLAFRQRVDVEQLRLLSARELVAYAIAQGWMSKSNMERTDLGDVKITGAVANADVVIAGTPSTQQFRFVRDAGRWYFDQLPLLTGADDQLKAAAAQRKMSEDQLIIALIEAASHKKVGEEIWTPPGDGAH